VLVFVASRYRLALVPVLAVLAAAGAPVLWRVARSGSPRARVLMAGYLLAVTAIMSLPGPFPEEEVRFDAELRYFLGRAREEESRWSEAEEHFRAAAELDPDMADAHFSLGTMIGRQDRVPEALPPLREAIRLAPRFARAHNNLGIALSKLGRLPEAERHFRAAIAAEPFMAEAYNNLAVVLADQGREQEAAAVAQQAPRIEPAKRND
jgi:Flp pilus assembly protein TadD